MASHYCSARGLAVEAGATADGLGRPVVPRDEDQNFTETAIPRRPWRNSGEMLTWPPPPGFS